MYKWSMLMVCVWFVALQLTALFADRVVPYEPSFPYVEIQLAVSGLPKNIYSWANFDGVHYLTIAKEGYLRIGLIQAFFPIFPLLLSLAVLLKLNAIVFGILINFLALNLTIILMCKELALRGIAVSQQKMTILLLLLFPTSFFFSAVYSESIFVLLVAATFYSISRKHWYRAAFFISIATATRIVGVFLIPCALFALCESYWLRENRSFTFRSVISIPRDAFGSGIALILLGSQGLLSYMYYLYTNFSDPFYFFNVQADFGGGRQESLVLLPQVLFRYLKIIFTTNPISFSYFASFQEFFLTILVAVGLYIAWKKKLAPYYQIIFGAAALLVPTLTGTLSSMPRYVLVALPAFSAFAWITMQYPKIKPIWFIGSTFLLAFNTILFVQGYWVA